MGISWKWSVLERMGQTHSTHLAVQPDILQYSAKQGIRRPGPSTKRDMWQSCSPFPRGDPADLWRCRNLCWQQLVGAQRRGKGGWRVAKTGSKVSCCDSDQVLTTNCPGINSSSKKAVSSWRLFGMSAWITNTLGWWQGHHNSLKTSSQRLDFTLTETQLRALLPLRAYFSKSSAWAQPPPQSCNRVNFRQKEKGEFTEYFNIFDIFIQFPTP